MQLQTIAQIIAAGNDVFNQKHPSVITQMGIIDKTFRNKGIPADAVTIENKAANLKIIFFIHDEKPGVITITIGDKEGNIFSNKEVNNSDLSEESVSSIFSDNLLTQ